MSGKKRGQPPKSYEEPAPPPEEPLGCNVFCHLMNHPHLKVPVNKPIVWVLGGPGSGKGTQCHQIVNKYGFTHLSTGDLLRDEVKKGTKRGKELAAIMLKGDLVPNEWVLDVLRDAINEKAASAKGFLIDGYPREKSQGKAFEETIAPADTILYFEAKPETLMKRLHSRAAESDRVDDNEKAFQFRLKTFFENNEQALAPYTSKLNRIDAEGRVDQIFGEVSKIMDRIVKA